MHNCTRLTVARVIHAVAKAGRPGNSIAAASWHGSVRRWRWRRNAGGDALLVVGVV